MPRTSVTRNTHHMTPVFVSNDASADLAYSIEKTIEKMRRRRQDHLQCLGNEDARGGASAVNAVSDMYASLAALNAALELALGTISWYSGTLRRPAENGLQMCVECCHILLAKLDKAGSRQGSRKRAGSRSFCPGAAANVNGTALTTSVSAKDELDPDNYFAADFDELAESSTIARHLTNYICEFDKACHFAQVEDDDLTRKLSFVRHLLLDMQAQATRSRLRVTPISDDKRPPSTLPRLPTTVSLTLTLKSIRSRLLSRARSDLDSRQAKRRSQQIDDQLRRDKRRVLTGCTAVVTDCNPEAGQVLVRSLEAMHPASEHVSREEVESAVVSRIHGLVEDVVRESDEGELGIDTRDLTVRVLDALHASEYKLDKGVDAWFEALWNNRQFRNVCARYKFTGPLDNALSDLYRLLNPSYTPNIEDIAFTLHLRGRITVTALALPSRPITINLVRPNLHLTFRKKWAHALEGAPVVIYVHDLSGYDRPLCAGGTATSLDESLALFASIAGSCAFQKSDFVLFLVNFGDFRKRLAEVPLRERFPDYKGNSEDVQAAAGYVLGRFRACVEGQGREVYARFCEFLDEGNVGFLFSSVEEILGRREARNSADRTRRGDKL